MLEKLVYLLDVGSESPTIFLWQKVQKNGSILHLIPMNLYIFGSPNLSPRRYGLGLFDVVSSKIYLFLLDSRLLDLGLSQRCRHQNY